MNKLTRIVFLILGLTAFSTTVQAVTKMYICDSCSTAEYKAKAESNAPINMISTAYVLDIDRERVTKWSVETERESGITFRWATQISVDSTMTQNFNKYITVLQDISIPFVIYPWIDNPYNSAFEFVGNPDGLNDLYDSFKNEFTWLDWSLSYFNALIIQMTTRVSSAFTVVRFYFPDGSFLELKAVDWDPTTLSFRFEYHYAEDENGDVIPLDPADYSPDAPISGGSLGDYFGNNGYTPVDGNGNPLGDLELGPCYRFAGCSDDGPNPVCTVIRITNLACPI